MCLVVFVASKVSGAVSPLQPIARALATTHLLRLNDQYGLAIGDAVWAATHDEAPELPTGIVGDNEEPSTGKRINTELPSDAFPDKWKKLTGAISSDEKGQQVCPNDVPPLSVAERIRVRGLL